MKRKTVGLIARIGACVGFSMFALTARAEYVECETPFDRGIPLQSVSRPHKDGLPNLLQVVRGSSLNVSSFSVAGPGQLSVQLTDIKFPDALSELSVLVTDMNNVWERIDVIDGIGSLSLDVSGPTQWFAAVFARSEGWNSPGLYHLNASFAPVPLPAAAWLLLSGIAGLGAAVRRRKQ